MDLVTVLLKDLERQYHFSGHSKCEATVGGLIRHLGNVRFMPVFIHRIAHHLYIKRWPRLSKMASLMNFLTFGLEIAGRCEIGPGLYFPHTMGTVVGARKIGANCTLYHQVTIGAKEVDLGYTPENRPLIGDNVVIGSGAKILGGIVIGDHVIVGANAVVIHSVPDNVVVGGIPARILKSIPAK